jgi:hypothetical protein
LAQQSLILCEVKKDFFLENHLGSNEF